MESLKGWCGRVGGKKRDGGKKEEKYDERKGATEREKK